MEQRNALLAARVVQALESRHFEAYFCKTGEEAVAKVLALMPEGGERQLRRLGDA